MEKAIKRPRTDDVRDNMSSEAAAVTETECSTLVRDNKSSHIPERPRIATPNEGQEPSAATLTESEKQDITKAVTDINTCQSLRFVVRCMDASTSPDPRVRLEQGIRDLADLLRDKPTLPADPQDASMPWSVALSSTAAVQLPAKHCAFANCPWTGALTKN